jgi:UDP-N-acetylmuramate-alanine ligase
VPFTAAWSPADDSNLMAVLPHSTPRRSMGWRIRRRRSRPEYGGGRPAVDAPFIVRARSARSSGMLELSVPGRHNLQNALAAVGRRRLSLLALQVAGAPATCLRGTALRRGEAAGWLS